MAYAEEGNDFKSGTRYIATTTAEVYQKSTLYDGSGVWYHKVGFIPQNVTCVLSELVYQKGTGELGRVSVGNTYTQTVQNLMDGKNTVVTNELRNKYVLFKCLATVSDSNRNQVSTTVSTDIGNVQITNIIYLPSTQHFYVQPNRTVQLWSGPGTTVTDIDGGQAKTTLVDKKKAGDMISVYATVKASNGATYAAASTSLNRWFMLLDVNGNMTSDIAKADGTQPSITEVMTGGSQGSESAVQGLAQEMSNEFAFANTSYADLEDPNDALDVSYATVADAFASASSAGAALTTDASAQQALQNMMHVIGIPPKITPTADIRYMLTADPKLGLVHTNNFGRVYTELFMEGNTLVSLQPCKVKYLPQMHDDEADTFFAQVGGMLGGELGDDADARSSLTGTLFEAVNNYGTYINTVNLLARSLAIYSGIGEKRYLGLKNAPKYANMDYSWYKIEKLTSDKVEQSNGFFGWVSKEARAAYSRVVTSAINDDTYLHFYGTADGTSVSDSLSVSTRESAMESLFNNNLSQIAQDIQFLAGGRPGTLTTIIDSVAAAGGGIGDSLGGTLGNLLSQSSNYLKGGRMVFPQMIDDCTYDRSFKVSCRFISPSGDPEARFLNCLLPLCYLYPYVIPQQMAESENMYTYPFLCRADVTGLFHSDLAVLSNLAIQRGGPDADAFTIDGLPFEIDVSFDITPLTSRLMVTTARHPIHFIRNNALQEYLGTMCGVSFTGDQMEIKAEVAKSLLGTSITDTLPTMLRSYYSSPVANWLRNVFTFNNW